MLPASGPAAIHVTSDATQDKARLGNGDVYGQDLTTSLQSASSDRLISDVKRVVRLAGLRVQQEQALTRSPLIRRSRLAAIKRFRRKKIDGGTTGGRNLAAHEDGSLLAARAVLLTCCSYGCSDLAAKVLAPAIGGSGSIAAMVNQMAAASGGQAGPLQRALLSRDPATLCFVLDFEKAPGFFWDMTTPDIGGMTPLHLAACMADGGAAAGSLLAQRPAAIAAWSTLPGPRGMTPAEMSRLPPSVKQEWLAPLEAAECGRPRSGGRPSSGGRRHAEASGATWRRGGCPLAASCGLHRVQRVALTLERAAEQLVEQGALQAAGFFAASSDGSDAGGEQRAERAVTASTRGAAQLRQACEGAVTPSAAAQCVTPAGDGTAAAVAAEPAKLEGTRRQSCTGAGVSSAGGPIQEVAPAEQAVQPEAPGKYQQTTAASGSRRSVRLAGGAGAASSSAAAEGLPRRQDEGGQGRQDEGEALVAGGAPAPFDPDDDIPTPAQRPQSRSLLPLLLALLATATALSVALPFTQKGAQSGILLGLAVAAAALLPLLFPRALLALAAPLSLSFSARVHSEELRFTECFNDSRRMNDTQASIVLCASCVVPLLRSLKFGCGRGAAVTHSAFFGLYILPMLLLIANRPWYVRRREGIIMGVRSATGVLTILWASGAIPRCTSYNEHVATLVVVAVAVHRAMILQVRLEQQLRLAPLEAAAMLLSAHYSGTAASLQHLLKLAVAATTLPVVVIWAVERRNRIRYEREPWTQSEPYEEAPAASSSAEPSGKKLQ